MWHDHFATSQLKVDDVAAMRAQNETFRRLARGPFGDLLRAMLRDPALLVWLDAPSNRKGKPNENLARELMELFTLGVGHYAETDVKEAARRLTGRTVVHGGFASPGRQSRRRREDDPRQDGPVRRRRRWPTTCWHSRRWPTGWPGGSVRRSWAKAWPTTRRRGELADQLRRDGLHVGRAVETILRSDLFFSERTCTRRVADPIGFAVGSVRALESVRPAAQHAAAGRVDRADGSGAVLPAQRRRLAGGRSWLSGRAVVARANFAAALAAGGAQPSRHGQSTWTGSRRGTAGAGDDRETIGWFGELLTGRPAEPAVADALCEGGRDAGRVRRPASEPAVALLLARPEAQLT